MTIEHTSPEFAAAAGSHSEPTLASEQITRSPATASIVPDGFTTVSPPSRVATAANALFARHAAVLHDGPEESLRSSEELIRRSDASGRPGNPIDINTILDSHSHVSIAEPALRDTRLAVQMANAIARRYGGEPALWPSGQRHVRLLVKLERYQTKFDLHMLTAMETLCQIRASGRLMVELHIKPHRSAYASDLDRDHMARLRQAVLGFGGMITLESFRDLEDPASPLMAAFRQGSIETLKLRNARSRSLSMLAQFDTPLKALSIGDDSVPLNRDMAAPWYVLPDNAVQAFRGLSSVEFVKQNHYHLDRDTTLIRDLSGEISEGTAHWESLTLNGDFRFEYYPRVLFDALGRGTESKITSLNFVGCLFGEQSSPNLTALAGSAPLKQLSLAHSRGVFAQQLPTLLASPTLEEIDLRGAQLTWPHEHAGTYFESVQLVDTIRQARAANPRLLVHGDEVLAQPNPEVEDLTPVRS
jgi:hypothetical protein